MNIFAERSLAGSVLASLAVPVLLLESSDVIGECPRFDGELVFWTDIDGRKMHSFNLETKEHKCREFDQGMGLCSFSLSRTPGGEKGFVVALRDGFGYVCVFSLF